MAALLLLAVAAFAQPQKTKFKPVISVGSRNTISAFSSDEATGTGVGAQFRVQPGRRINTEWYFDYIFSKTEFSIRNDYHIGWSLLFYPKTKSEAPGLFQPYLIAGHCFDHTQVFEKNHKANQESRLSLATQAGVGTHINITPRFDCTLAGQYMLHFGKEIEAELENEKVVIYKTNHSGIDGHMLLTVGFNYKLTGTIETVSRRSK